MLSRANALVEDFDTSKHPRSVFSTKDQKRTSDAYFLDSGNHVSFFFEEDAFAEAFAVAPDETVAQAAAVEPVLPQELGGSARAKRNIGKMRSHVRHAIRAFHGMIQASAKAPEVKLACTGRFACACVGCPRTLLQKLWLAT